MDLNSILFPAPKSSYTTDKICGELIWIPKRNVKEDRFDTLQQQSVLNTNTDSPEMFISDTSSVKTRNFEQLSKTLVDSCSQDTKSNTCSNVPVDLSKNQSFNNSNDINGESNTSKTLTAEEILVSEDVFIEMTTPSKPYLSKLPFHKSIDATNKTKCNAISLKEEIPLNCLSNHCQKTSKALNDHNNIVKYDSKTGTSNRDLKRSGVISNKWSQNYQSTKQQQVNKGLTRSQNRQNKVCVQLNVPNKKHAFTHKTVSKKKSNENNIGLKVCRDESQANFKSNNIDEYAEQNFSMYSPRSLIRYCTETISSPVTKVGKLVLVDPNQKKETLESDFSFEEIQECTAPSNSRIRSENYDIRKELFKYDKLDMTTSLLSSASYTRAAFYNSFEDQSKEIEQSYSVNLRDKMTSNPFDTQYIPCVLHRSTNCSSKILIYFHGNSEDINLAKELLLHMRVTLNVSN